jgi:hypothetical protein
MFPSNIIKKGVNPGCVYRPATAAVSPPHGVHRDEGGVQSSLVFASTKPEAEFMNVQFL